MSEEDTNIKPDLPDPPKLDLGDEVSLTKKMLQSAPTEEIKKWRNMLYISKQD